MTSNSNQTLQQFKKTGLFYYTKTQGKQIKISAFADSCTEKKKKELQ